MENKNLRLGISIYQDKHDFKEIKDYICLAHKYGFGRIFTSLLQTTPETKIDDVAKLQKVCEYGKSLGFDMIVDVSPRVFEQLDIVLPDVSFFNKIGATTIRMDAHENGFIEKQITENPYGIKLEVNMSSFRGLGAILNEIKIDKSKLYASHNFYPQRFTGLPLDYFMKNTNFYKEIGVKTFAFVSSPNAKIGPWPIMEGMPTLEMHRELPVVSQAKHLFLLGIDGVLISNAFATEEELRNLSLIEKNKISLDVIPEENITKIENKIVFEYDKHFRRGDINDYSIRSTMTRVMYKQETIIPSNLQHIQLPGEIYVGNDDFKNYKAEMHLILKEMPGSEKKNKIGEVADYDKFLIKYIEGWDSFKLIKKDKK